MANKNPVTKWKKGQSGNPTGRPKDTASFRALCRDKTPVGFKRLMAIIEGSENEGVVVKAVQVLIENGHGKPTQTTEVSGPNGEAIQIEGTPRLAPVDVKEWLKLFNS